MLDEADEMLDLGFREDMEFILKTTPASRRTLLFSATLPRGIVALAKTYQQQALRVEVEGDEGGHADIEYRAIRIAAADVEHAVVNMLRFFDRRGALVFCNTRNAVRHLQATLSERGFSVVALSGELTQNERTQALQSLRDGRARVCVATDVAARGIDLPNLDLVIHADLPNDAEVMQHRSGRTGRAGRKGVSVLLVPPARKRRAELLLNLAGIDAVWGTAPTSEEIRKLDQERMLKDTLFAGRDDAGGSGAGAGHARRADAGGYRSGPGAALSLAAAVAGRHSRSRPRCPIRDDRGREKGTRPQRARIARPRRGQSRENRRRVTPWRKAACGFAPPSAARRMRKRAGCCR